MDPTRDHARPLDFDAFHRDELLQTAATADGRAAARDVAGAPAIAFRLPDGRAYRLASRGEAIAVTAGTEDAVVIDLAESAWCDLVREVHTAAGLFYGGRLGGDAARVYPVLERWEPALRQLVSGRPIFDPDRVDLRDRHGAPLDPRASFDLDAPTEDLRHFLDATGYLHLRSVFGPAEIARLTAIVEASATEARPGDGTSWWSKHGDGSDALCRLIYLGMRAPEIAALDDDPRLLRLAALGAEPLVPVPDRSDGHTAVIKVPGASGGLADLPWHRDCGLGGHSITCPTMLIGIQLDAANAASGQLHFVAGSWRSSYHRSDIARAARSVVAIDTEPGDCTVHWSDVLHAAPPPTGSGRGRRALYVGFMPPRALDVIGPRQSYNDVIRARVGG